VDGASAWKLPGTGPPASDQCAEFWTNATSCPSRKIGMIVRTSWQWVPPRKASFMMKMSPSWIASLPTHEITALTVCGSVPTWAGRSSFPSAIMRPSGSQIAALKSRPSLTTSEWPTRSSIRPISSTTLMNAFRSTSKVIGSIRLPIWRFIPCSSRA
jgi:hypothetical protein